ncbi:hypothetical protein [Streptomyces sp. NPDC058665]|uniref:hypothetical protein n=1 Tax=Streptomyces sp. NPDC058665 TaxID=3346586 RepID=UPI00364CFB4A
MDTESLYLDLYDAVADRAEYTQADSSQRAALTEAVITALTAGALGAFVTGFAQRLAERTSDGLVDRVKGLLHRGAGQGDDDPAQAVEALQLLEAYLPLLRDSTAAQRLEEERWVAVELESRGFPSHVAAAVAAEMVGRIRDADGRNS